MLQPPPQAPARQRPEPQALSPAAVTAWRALWGGSRGGPAAIQSPAGEGEAGSHKDPLSTSRHVVGEAGMSHMIAR